MSSSARLKWFHDQLQACLYPSIRNLSEYFEISYRQSQRDIEYMRDFLGAPIAYSSKNKGYFYTEDFSMPTIFLSLNEVNYLKKLSDYYNSLHDLGLIEYKNYGEIFNRISSNYANPKKYSTTLKIPYMTKIRFTDLRYSYRLLDKFLRNRIDEIFVYEFDNVEIFIGLLLSCGGNFEIIFPHWLRKRVFEICQITIKNNKI